MAQISSYPVITPQLGDKVLGSNLFDSSGNAVVGNPTCQYNFTSIKQLVDQSFVSQLESSSAVASQSSTLNTAYNITFGTPENAVTDNVQLLQGGGTLTAGDTIRFNTIGSYQITLTYSVGVNQSSANIPYLVFRTLQDGTTQVGPTIIYNEKFETINNPIPLVIPITVQITKAQTLYTFQMARNGVNDGGLVKNAGAISAGIIPAPTAPSVATIQISKLI
jgi:hypothetical protein|tara:strand:+ start:50 stop:712 length:663 start_codon:yes stop_codon:yes gene_type:complete